jgi:lipopolysaccharide biosynthesis protein
VLKLHTKRSQHREHGDACRKELLEEMLSKRSLERILRAFDEEPKLGLVGPSGHMLSTKTYFGYNESRVRYITRRMGFRELDPGATPFPAGSMYFARMDALRPLLDAHFKECEFEAESGAVDGTMAHAVERSIGVSCIGSGHFLSASSEPRVRIEHGSQTYRFAIAFRA